MKITIYGHEEDVESLDSIITFRTGSQRDNDEEENLDWSTIRKKRLSEMSFQRVLVSYGFSGTVREALEKYPDIVKIVD